MDHVTNQARSEMGWQRILLWLLQTQERSDGINHHSNQFIYPRRRVFQARLRAPPEPERSLSDAAKEYVTRVERYLPPGSQVYTYPVDARLEAAVINADLDGDGVPETVVVYNTRKPTAEEGSLPLMLGVLASDNDKRAFGLRASAHLAGGVLLTSRIEGLVGPLSVRSATGRTRPEIVVIPGVGASIGFALQVFCYDRSGLTEGARIGGHFFRVRSTGRGKPAIITARGRFDEESRVYEFKGDKFQETARIKSDGQT